MAEARSLIKRRAAEDASVEAIRVELGRFGLNPVERAPCNLLADHEVRVNGAAGRYRNELDRAEG